MELQGCPWSIETAKKEALDGLVPINIRKSQCLAQEQTRQVVKGVQLIKG